jgi:hypothetical protein
MPVFLNAPADGELANVDERASSSDSGLWVLSAPRCIKRVMSSCVDDQGSFWNCLATTAHSFECMCTDPWQTIRPWRVRAIGVVVGVEVVQIALMGWFPRLVVAGIGVPAALLLAEQDRNER